MRYRTVVLGAFLLLLALPAAHAAEMTIDFSWAGVEGCRGAGISPRFRVTNPPPGTRSLLFTLEKVVSGRSGNDEYGGSSVPLPPDGVVPPGVVYANGPCAPGQYQWIVVAQDAGGKDLATARKVEPYPQ